MTTTNAFGDMVQANPSGDALEVWCPDAERLVPVCECGPHDQCPEHSFNCLNGGTEETEMEAAGVLLMDTLSDFVHQYGAQKALGLIGVSLGVMWANHHDERGNAFGLSAHYWGGESHPWADHGRPHFTSDDDFDNFYEMAAAFYWVVREETGATTFLDD
jgi:hypothetical protein